ncbi:DUF4272 domain-containing protein [Sphingomonas sp. So64.6b]|uniref:DUF4272 domain-containing protein n=1 Tax=Sphingomonas sp. So64.6b TaxID=2997354 RepID=UPI0016024562|nr:DUF4272 domain-containing protein [Sphingomonas sp. So64.6b]QNA82895.1 DUF4272 domain-containing protein [Sphingomonas sp. So64.6b]
MNFLKRLFGRGELAPETPAAPVESLLINAYATVRDLPPLDFPHQVRGRRDLSDPELAPHLEGFIGYVMGRGDGQMTTTRYHLWRHLQRVRNHISFEAIPPDLPQVEAWARMANAVLFLPDGSVRAPDMAVIMSAEGETSPSAALPYQPDAVARRERTRERLKLMDPQPPASIPPAIGEAEVVLRPPAEVLQRALALFYVAVRAQVHRLGVEPIPGGQREHNPIGFASLTPREAAFVESGASDLATATTITWRFEAANTLLWALGFDAAHIADSDQMIDVDALWLSVASAACNEAGAEAAQLRPVREILDALDRTWLEHWAARQASQKGIPLVAISRDVVAERHAALNWLASFQNDFDVSWDDTDTPT